jgi:hypothetical protein
MRSTGINAPDAWLVPAIARNYVLPEKRKNPMSSMRLVASVAGFAWNPVNSMP